MLAATLFELGWMAYDIAGEAVSIPEELAALLMLAAAGLGLYLPLVMALFVYAFRSPELWPGRLSAPA